MGAVVWLATACRLLLLLVTWLLLACVPKATLTAVVAECPDQSPELQPWSPGHDPQLRVHIRGSALLLTSSATVHSIHISAGGKLVVRDGGDVVLRARHVLLEDRGQLHVGSTLCPFQGNFSIVLYGRADEGEPHPYFGLKFLGVGQGGTLELHGQRKLAWTFLARTLRPGGLQEGGYFFERSWGHRGVIVHVIDPRVGTVTHSERFDTYSSQRESGRLVQFLDTVPDGRILALAVNDEGSRSLDAEARAAVTRLGSKHFLHLGFRHPWSFLTVKGHPLASVEDHVEHHGPLSPASACVSKLFLSEHREHFNVSSCSTWVQDLRWTEWFQRDGQSAAPGGEKLLDLQAAYPGRICRHPTHVQAKALDGESLAVEAIHTGALDFRFLCHRRGQACGPHRVRFLCRMPVRPRLTLTIDTNINSSLLTLADDVRSWRPGDRLVVASTDYSMLQAEEFRVLPCRACTPNQVRVAGRPRYLHMGEQVDGVDMRAEVGLLSRNVVVRGEMEAACYPYANHLCSFFSFDTFGGHIKVALGFEAVHLEGVELMHMGQQLVGQYPLHFHLAGDLDERGGYDPPTYVRELSIHHTFSRCVTVHGSNGLLVKDVVGYDSLGHCFFTEDGPEERNTFDHCLGLLVKSGTLLPSDRDSHMCRTITEDSYPGYVPKPRQDCNAVSTFWMANPNNNLINCAAAGSEETGFWFIFHHVPTGPSAGAYSPGYSEHSPLGKFQNNRAHSNYRAGMIIDNGVKTTEASARDKRPFLSIISARYSPHQDADPLKPREPAIIRGFTAYKNQEHGAWLRGGDVWLDSCCFADNGIGLTLASGGTFPYDDGSKQEVRNSLFVGESGNVGNEMTDNRAWGPGGWDHSGRTLPIGQDFPIRGVQLYDGPVSIRNCTFRKFVALEGRHTSALAFRLNNAWQSCPHNSVTNITFQDVPITSRVFFGEPGPWFNQLDMDGDKTSVFHDVDGSVSEYPGSYLTKDDNWLVRHPGCLDVPDWRGAICSGHYAQMYIQADRSSGQRMKMVKDELPQHPLVLEGALARSTHYQQYQPVVALRKGYTIHWDQPAPAELAIWLINFNRGDWVRVGLCYPRGTSFSILADVHDRRRKRTSKTGTFERTRHLEQLGQGPPGRGLYFWDEDSGLLFLRLEAQHSREPFAFCSVEGCERIRVRALLPPGAPPSDCTARAYPRYTQTPVEDVPMPSKLAGTQLGPGRFLEVKMESSVQRFSHLSSAAAYIQVDGRRFPGVEDGVQLVVVDGARGHVLGRASFRNVVLQGAPWQLANYVGALPDGSIVLVASRGRCVSRGPWARVLEQLGADRGFRMKAGLRGLQGWLPASLGVAAHGGAGGQDLPGGAGARAEEMATVSSRTVCTAPAAALGPRQQAGTPRGTSASRDWGAELHGEWRSQSQTPRLQGRPVSEALRGLEMDTVLRRP
ncbi:cell migration-inducing and hyaluronan-binding protein isoform X3 [Erinaceus europaeus]|uniref:hyaluronoglucosaminidase n=1 Tax=Erinaceus europaeus TaxID=9365 RepID=A0ABM3WG86_ERIEU|nr:cell migration-inducing and hyaluronan-binding protein isoform X3 [Erinaceus europaeus]